jgi:hypothetical protein
MKIVRKSLLLVALATTLAPCALAQRQRSVSDPTKPLPPPSSQEEPQGQSAPKVRAPTPPPPPKVVPAKYMGGFAGYRKKQEGMLSFDERNQRLVFRDKNEKEIISISYEAVMVAFADTETRRTMGQGSSQVLLSTVGILGAPALLFKKKFEYLTIQFEDPETYLKGTTQFKLANKEMIDSVAYALAQRAGLSQQGEIYARRRSAPTTQPASAEKTSNP